MIINSDIYHRSVSFFIILLFSLCTYAQQKLSGVIYDDSTKEPLEAVVIYFDGTTQGTITDAVGKFFLEINSNYKGKVIITYLGYKTVILDLSTMTDYNNVLVYLTEEIESLDPIYLKTDDWSREKKLRYFKKYFIGELWLQEQCEIINEKDIRLYYSAAEETLYASSSIPLTIRNNYLGYTVTYYLTDFELKFSLGSSGLRLVNSIYLSGTSFFKESRKKIKKKYISRRKESFEGSMLHFMRSLALKELKENKFRVFYKGFAGDPYKYFSVKLIDNFAKVSLGVDRVSILYNEKHQTDMWMSTDYFLIDGFGNYTPTDQLFFSGYMANQRVGMMLPLDYNL
ncbi:carboxypeptidase-like regulatory domain-containing protein [Aquimarina sp. 2201CG14-23]|uniref:carboxypeptidase-like regulatory domain-containing protein n=1 Tax=Aquimarina mycalae TaxID=3040073 RepID=UPI002477F770|nr:carboxypeptidase-like regulatory domain-containing protein [Aquimarina sp. 2201CG14-23]MDH7447506.1 carboxypeptidase-like regulatory domain-containing protein [Aquimarina sp. 2201CG14-23]